MARWRSEGRKVAGQIGEQDSVYINGPVRSIPAVHQTLHVAGSQPLAPDWKLSVGNDRSLHWGPMSMQDRPCGLPCRAAVLGHRYRANVDKLDRGLILVSHEVIDINKLALISRMGD